MFRQGERRGAAAGAQPSFGCREDFEEGAASRSEPPQFEGLGGYGE